MAAQIILTEATFYILLSLISGEAHGYAILKSVQRLSGDAVKLSTSTLYTALGRLLEQGHIERVASREAKESNRPRKAYRLTDAGKLALAAEEQRMLRMVAAVQRQVGEMHP
jgi:DNA-binding PadR family transcriptional regulator